MFGAPTTVNPPPPTVDAETFGGLVDRPVQHSRSTVVERMDAGYRRDLPLLPGGGSLVLITSRRRA